jgi:hypothetical protein
MTLSRTYPAGVPVPQKIRCPDEIVVVERDDRKAVVRTERRSSIAQLGRLGFKSEVELDPDPPGDVKPGEITDPEAYEQAKRDGLIAEVEQQPEHESEPEKETEPAPTKKTRRGASPVEE